MRRPHVSFLESNFLFLKCILILSMLKTISFLMIQWFCQGVNCPFLYLNVVSYLYCITCFDKILMGIESGPKDRPNCILSPCRLSYKVVLSTNVDICKMHSRIFQHRYDKSFLDR